MVGVFLKLLFMTHGKVRMTCPGRKDRFYTERDLSSSLYCSSSPGWLLREALNLPWTDLSVKWEGETRPVIFKLWWTSEELLKTQTLGSPPVSVSGGLGWGLRTCTSNKFRWNRCCPLKATKPTFLLWASTVSYKKFINYCVFNEPPLPLTSSPAHREGASFSKEVSNTAKIVSVDICNHSYTYLSLRDLTDMFNIWPPRIKTFKVHKTSGNVANWLAQRHVIRFVD